MQQRPIQCPPSGIPVEDLGGPTPENYKPDDDSAKLKDPAANTCTSKDVVNAKATKAEEADELQKGSYRRSNY